MDDKAPKISTVRAFTEFGSRRVVTGGADVGHGVNYKLQSRCYSNISD